MLSAVSLPWTGNSGLRKTPLSTRLSSPSLTSSSPTPSPCASSVSWTRCTRPRTTSSRCGLSASSRLRSTLSLALWCMYSLAPVWRALRFSQPANLSHASLSALRSQSSSSPARSTQQSSEDTSSSVLSRKRARALSCATPTLARDGLSGSHSFWLSRLWPGSSPRLSPCSTPFSV